MIPSIADRNYDNLSDDFTRFDPTDGSAIIYIGTNGDPDALDTDLNWIIKKISYSGTVITQIVRKKGSWTNRAALF